MVSVVITTHKNIVVYFCGTSKTCNSFSNFAVEYTTGVTVTEIKSFHSVQPFKSQEYTLIFELLVQSNLVEFSSHVNFTDDGGFVQPLCRIFCGVCTKNYVLFIPEISMDIANVYSDLPIPFVRDDYIHGTVITTSRFHVTDDLFLS